MQKVLFSCFGRGVLLSCSTPAWDRAFAAHSPGNTECAPPWLSTSCRITAVLSHGAEPLQRLQEALADSSKQVAEH